VELLLFLTEKSGSTKNTDSHHLGLCYQNKLIKNMAAREGQGRGRQTEDHYCPGRTH